MSSFGGKQAGDQVRLENTLLVITPFLAPDVLVLNYRSHNRVLRCLEPEQTVRLDFGFDAVNHSEDADGRTAHCRSIIVIGAVQIERSITRAECLPVVVVELDVKHVWVESTRVVLAVDLRLLLQPKLERNVRNAPRDHRRQFVFLQVRIGAIGAWDGRY